jgi:hypothetical protein
MSHPGHSLDSMDHCANRFVDSEFTGGLIAPTYSEFHESLTFIRPYPNVFVSPSLWEACTGRTTKAKHVMLRMGAAYTHDELPAILHASLPYLRHGYPAEGAFVTYMASGFDAPQIQEWVKTHGAAAAGYAIRNRRFTAELRFNPKTRMLLEVTLCFSDFKLID